MTSQNKILLTLEDPGNHVPDTPLRAGGQLVVVELADVGDGGVHEVLAAPGVPKAAPLGVVAGPHVVGDLSERLLETLTSKIA